LEGSADRDNWDHFFKTSGRWDQFDRDGRDHGYKAVVSGYAGMWRRREAEDRNRSGFPDHVYRAAAQVDALRGARAVAVVALRDRIGGTPRLTGVPSLGFVPTIYRSTLKTSQALGP
jgi:hypothetical protein